MLLSITEAGLIVQLALVLLDEQVRSTVPLKSLVLVIVKAVVDG